MTKDNELPRLNVNAVEKKLIGNGKQFEASVGRFTEPLNMKKIGCGIVELKPGKKAWPYHLHYSNEELFIVIKGCGIIRYNDVEHDISEGDVIFTPPGDGTAHQIINNSDESLLYYAISSMLEPEICYYPDSDKYGSYFYENADGGRKAVIVKSDAHVDYYFDEDE